MSAARLTLSVLAVVGAMLASSGPVFAEAAGGAGGAGSDAVGSWVIGHGPGSGVAPPSGTPCTGWDAAANLSPQDGAVDLVTVRVDSAGIRWILYYRKCVSTIQYVWVPVVPAAQLGKIAYDEVMRLLPAPDPAASPSLSVGGYVNFETWFAVQNPGVVAATSSIPGLSATARARVVRVVWSTGDGVTKTCSPFGSLPPSPGYTGAAPCGHTYLDPSVPAMSGTADGSFHGSVRLVWHVTWSATNGASGDLGEASTSAPFTYRVREVQTIGVGG